jgi:hypothetical protein
LYSDYRSRKCSFWLGHSPDHKEWALAAIPWSEEDPDGCIFTYAYYSACKAILIDPLKMQEDVIFRILFLINNETEKTNSITSKKINEIFKAVPFSEYLPAQTYLPELSKDWLHMPVELNVSFELSEGSCAPPSIFREYNRNSLKEALEVLYGPRHDGLLIYYFLVVHKVIPFLGWDVDWPLSRRGKEPPFRREKVQGASPDEYHPDQSIMTVYQSLHSRSLWGAAPFYGQPGIRLRVGGRSQEEAIANWHQCAKALRKMKPARK